MAKTPDLAQMIFSKNKQPNSAYLSVTMSRLALSQNTWNNMSKMSFLTVPFPPISKWNHFGKEEKKRSSFVNSKNRSSFVNSDLERLPSSDGGLQTCLISAVQHMYRKFPKSEPLFVLLQSSCIPICKVHQTIGTHHK